MTDAPRARCAVCGAPFPTGPKRIPHRKYCGPICSRRGRDSTSHVRRVQALRLLRFMERRTPAALDRLLDAMEADRGRPGQDESSPLLS
jgi:hypothetical protein